MGLKLQGCHVIIEHTCQDWLLTTPEGNPTVEKLCDLKVWSLFKRQRLSGKHRRDRTQRQLGDNCPLIYALKRKEGLYTDLTSIKKLLVSFNIILHKMAEFEPEGYQLIISMPSAHNISHIVGRRFSRLFHANHVTDLFRKITVGEAFCQLALADISVIDRSKIEHRIKLQVNEVGLGGSFSLKSIPANLRECLPPLMLNAIPRLQRHPARILIVDDLMASGTTINTAARILSQLYPDTLLHAACLFSSVRKQPARLALPRASVYKIQPECA